MQEEFKRADTLGLSLSFICCFLLKVYISEIIQSSRMKKGWGAEAMLRDLE